MTRWIAWQVCWQVMTQGRSFPDALAEKCPTSLSDADRRFVKALSFHALRHGFWLQACLPQFLRKPLKSKDHDIQLVLIIGMVQLLVLETPSHAAVKETVALVNKLKKTWAKGLVNAVLRSVDRQRKHCVLRNTLQHALPTWLMQRIRAAYPKQWKVVVEQSLQPAPMHLRVNQQKTTTAVYQQRLAEQGHAASLHTELPYAITLAKPVDVHQLPDFDKGVASVQDLSPQWVMSLLEVQAGQRVLDACAAPGGKTAAMLEAQPDCYMLALDHDAKRLQRVKETQQRLGLVFDVQQGDACQQTWWDGKPFDRILLDAPCSATGVIRRHPDIMHLRQAEDIDALVQTQQAMLNNVWQMLAPGGKLLYATCSILPDENDLVIDAFLAQHPAATCVLRKALLPEHNGGDGFYYALLVSAK